MVRDSLMDGVEDLSKDQRKDLIAQDTESILTYFHAMI